MKRVILVVMSFYLIPTFCLSQKVKDSTAAYFTNPVVPDFKILLSDSTAFYTNKDIPSNKNVVLIYFSPDCEHCQHEAKLIHSKLDSLQDLYFVWVAPSYSRLIDGANFAKKYNLDKLPNMVFGRESEYKLPVYYQIAVTPYAAVYTKKNKLFYEFRNGIPMKELIDVEMELMKTRN